MKRSTRTSATLSEAPKDQCFRSLRAQVNAVSVPRLRGGKRESTDILIALDAARFSSRKARTLAVTRKKEKKHLLAQFANVQKCDHPRVLAVQF